MSQCIKHPNYIQYERQKHDPHFTGAERDWQKFFKAASWIGCFQVVQAPYLWLGCQKILCLLFALGHTEVLWQTWKSSLALLIYNVLTLKGEQNLGEYFHGGIQLV